MMLEELSIQRVLESVEAVVREPTSNLTAAAILLVAATTVALILVLAALLVILAPRKPVRPAEGPEATLSPEQKRLRERRTRRSRNIIGVAAIASAALALGIGYARAGTDQACLSCHSSDSELLANKQAGAHAGVSCWDCHGGAGVASGFAARLAYPRWIVSIADPDQRTGSADIDDRACMRCHEDDLAVVIQTEHVRMDHAHPLEAGYACGACHLDIAHGNPEAARGFVMAECITCHDGKTASAECGTCHVTDVSRPAGTVPERFPKVEMGAPADCRGCHSIESCTECHGIEMPHPAVFADTGAHAKQAGFEKRALCEKCHDVEGFCNRCHQFGSAHEGASWRVAHGGQSRAFGERMCTQCHSRSEDFCGLCHEAGG